MKDVIESVEMFDTSNVQHSTFNIRECEFSYRDSIFKKHPEWIILSVTLRLKKGDTAAIQNEIKRITAERAAKQDIGTKSCGCIFKNVSWQRSDIKKEELLARFPELAEFRERASIPASFLIDRTGLKGRTSGHVHVSRSHANFFVNDGGATAADVRDLVASAKEKVQARFGIALEEEIQYIGF